MAAGILEGIRIVDCSIGLAGPEATRLLAEVGADVIKVEPPEGDVTRGSAGFSTWNRSKRGVVLDLRDPTDIAELHDLLATADVLVHGFRPSEAEARELDDASLSARHPNLITCGITGYPRNHPDAERSGWDVLVQARSGAMWEVDGARPGPIFLRFPLPSWNAMYLAISGILSRLIVRERTGRGGPCHTSLYQGMLAVLAVLWHRGEFLPDMMKAKVPMPKGAPGPATTMFQCKDGEWLQTLLGFTDHPLVVETVASLGYPYQDVPIGLPTPEQVQVFAEAFATRPRDEWLAAFYEGDVPAAPFTPLGSLFSDEQVLRNEYVVDVDDPQWGRARQVLAPYQIAPPPTVRGPAPVEVTNVDELPESASHTSSTGASRRDPYPDHRLLEGLKVLDLGMFLAGPFGPMMAGDLGADVIKVEPLTGDRMRTPHQMMLFVGCQRSKRAIAVDLQNPESKSVLEALIKWADVVHHNLRMPKAHKLGLDYDSIKAINPDVVFTHVSSYGSTGPKADWPGYDPMGQALSGWPLESTPPGAKPMYYRFGMMDHQCAMASMIPTLLGVFHRTRTGEAMATHGSLLAGATETNSETMLDLDSGETAPYPMLNPEQSRIDPGYGIYRVGDRWVAVAAIGEKRMSALRGVAGVTNDEGIADGLAEQDADEVLAALEAAGVPAELVREDYEQGFFDAELGGDALAAVSYQHPEFGLFSQPGAFWDLGDLELRLDTPPPMLGEHTLAILTELGFDEADIDKFVTQGIVGVYEPSGNEDEGDQ